MIARRVVRLKLMKGPDPGVGVLRMKRWHGLHGGCYPSSDPHLTLHLPSQLFFFFFGVKARWRLHIASRWENTLWKNARKLVPGAVSVSGAAHLQPLGCGEERARVDLSWDEEASSSSGAKGLDMTWRIDDGLHFSGFAIDSLFYSVCFFTAEGGTG